MRGEATTTRDAAGRALRDDGAPLFRTFDASRTLLAGLTREAAARFAFLLSVPGIALAGGYEGFKFATGVAGESVPVAEMLLGLVVSAVVGYFCIHYFLRFIARIGFLPFTVYRLLLAGFIVLVFA